MVFFLLGLKKDMEDEREVSIPVVLGSLCDLGSSSFRHNQQYAVHRAVSRCGARQHRVQRAVGHDSDSHAIHSTELADSSLLPASLQKDSKGGIGKFGGVEEAAGAVEAESV